MSVYTPTIAEQAMSDVMHRLRYSRLFGQIVHTRRAGMVVGCAEHLSYISERDRRVRRYAC